MKNGLISGITKIGMVVSNLDDVIEGYRKIGHEPAVVMEMSGANVRNLKIYGNLEDTRAKIAVYKFDSLMLEIVMPIDKNNIYWEFLEKTGGGIHHIGIQSKAYSYSDTMNLLESNGINEVMYGEVPSGVAFSYMDASKSLGTYLEIFNYDSPKF